MSSKIKILQVIPKLGYGGAETGCFDLAHYLHEHNCKSYIVTSGGPLLKYINKKKVKILRLPVQSKNPILIFVNSILLTLIILRSIRDQPLYQMKNQKGTLQIYIEALTLQIYNTRKYYEKNGYVLENTYMVKNLPYIKYEIKQFLYC